jgi:hypothetical protein
MKYLFDFDEKKTSITKGDETLSSEEIEKVLARVNDAAVFETGLIPVYGTGLLSYRRGFGYEQFVYQIEPQVHTVAWGKYEQDDDKPMYRLAQPWKIIIADFLHGSFVGVRHFYSPVQIYTLDQYLYAINLPNTNTVGYNGTSVGWTCLYQHHDTTQFSFVEKINYFVERESGLSEPYNDFNMSTTDGPRFYLDQKAPAYMYDPIAWEDKTTQEGVDWICDEKVLIPLKIDWKNAPCAQFHDAKGEHYTLRDAMYKPYEPYYPHGIPYDSMLNTFSSNPSSIEAYQNAIVQQQIQTLWRTGRTQQETGNKPKEVSIENLIAKLNKVQIDKIYPKQVHLSDGVLCQCCGKKYPSDTQLHEVVTEIHLGLGEYQTIVKHENEGFLAFDELIANTILDSPTCVRQNWCDLCLKTKATIPYEAIRSNLWVADSQLEYVTHDEHYHFSFLLLECPTCKKKYFYEDYVKHMIVNLAACTTDYMKNIIEYDKMPMSYQLARMYSLLLHGAHVGCTDCLATPVDTSIISVPGMRIRFYIPDFTGSFDDYPHLLQKGSKAELNMVEQTMELQTTYYPITYLNAIQKQICPCGLLSTSSQACATCVGPNGEYENVWAKTLS